MKRAFDLLIASLALVVLSPVILLCMLLIKLESSGPALYRQQRVGRDEKPFLINKLRTMRTDAGRKGPLVSTSVDPRITRVGRALRRFKLDELPQLYNVVVGHMSIVGPRPEVPRYVAHYPADMRRKIFSIRPGITDLASIEYFDENEVLTSAEDPESTYIKEILPRKLEYYSRYVDSQSFWLDLKIIAATAARIAGFR